MSHKNFREASRDSYTAPEKQTYESINIGCMQRIADAVEVIAKDRVKLERDLKWYQDAYNRAAGRIKELENQVKGLKAAKSRYRNQLNFQKNADAGTSINE